MASSAQNPLSTKKQPHLLELFPLLPLCSRPAMPNGMEAQATAETGAKPLSKTEQLVADLIAAGGRLTLPDETGQGGINWRQRAYAAQRHGKVPDGKRLSVAWTKAGFEIELLDGETGNELGADAVPVPARLAK